ncbi:MAG: DUF1460 domain-containing protein [Actinobacteria bacterium]|nr:DUF1460 domain-containing protein [Actinomycetota bacterium]
MIASIIFLAIISTITVLYQSKTEKESKIPREGTKEEAGPDKEEELIQNKKIDGSNWQWVNNQKKLYQLSSVEINSILKELQKRFLNKDEKLKALSILRLGTPYQFGCLGEESGRDKDPLFRLDLTDCTGFVLTNVALLHAENLTEAREMMRSLNYRLKENEEEYKTSFENRLHFTADRNMTSLYFQDVTEQIAGFDKIKEKKVILNKIKPDGERLIDIVWEKEIIIKYIPNEYITKELLSSLPKAVGIAFIKEGDEEIGLDVRHEGFLFSSEFLFHATSAQGEVMTVDFFKYYFDKEGDPKFNGIILFDVR